jgi:prophage tail gpP-like protein
MSDDLTLTVGNQTISGWLEVRVTRGIERCPSDFEIELTERFPGEADGVSVKPVDACVVKLGDDPVITGFIDRTGYAISAAQHTLSVSGRGKCADLVDCSAEWPGGQISGADALEIATKLAKPYGITVSAPGSTGVRVQTFNLMIGESAFDVIERVCRFGALLAYELPDGSLVLAQAGKEKAASGFTQGVNVQTAGITYSSDQRFSQYECFLQSMDVLADAGEGGNLLANAADPGIERHRLKYIVTEAPGGGVDFAQKRVTWEANRRIGRSMQLHLTTDSWRDAAGALWAPNTLVPLALPILKCGSEQDKRMWLISEVTYRRDAAGTACDLTIMPPDAFLPLPIIQLPSLADIPTGAAQ